MLFRSAHLKDSEEFNHIRNAKEMARAAHVKILQENKAPDEGASETFTLTDLYDDDRLEEMIDPSSGEDETPYDPSATQVTVENISPTGNKKAKFKYFVLLQSSGGYKYIDESDLSDPGKVDAKDLTRDHVEIPKRNAAGL